MKEAPEADKNGTYYGIPFREWTKEKLWDHVVDLEAKLHIAEEDLGFLKTMLRLHAGVGIEKDERVNKSLINIVPIRNPRSRLQCKIFGHAKIYVGVVDFVFEAPCPHNESYLKYCLRCQRTVQIVRWVCCCRTMGEDHIARGKGLYKVEAGLLVPDEKRWAHHLETPPKEEGRG